MSLRQVWNRKKQERHVQHQTRLMLDNMKLAAGGIYQEIRVERLEAVKQALTDGADAAAGHSEILRAAIMYDPGGFVLEREEQLVVEIARLALEKGARIYAGPDPEARAALMINHVILRGLEGRFDVLTQTAPRIAGLVTYGTEVKARTDIRMLPNPLRSTYIYTGAGEALLVRAWELAEASRAGPLPPLPGTPERPQLSLVR